MKRVHPGILVSVGPNFTSRSVATGGFFRRGYRGDRIQPRRELHLRTREVAPSFVRRFIVGLTDLSLSRGEAPLPQRQSGAPLAATNVNDGGQRLQAA